MNICFVILLAMEVLGLGIVLARHGQRRENYSFWVTFTSSALIWALYWGAGFFDLLIVN
jgi:hypothetical protein